MLEGLVFATECKNNVDSCLGSQKKVNYYNKVSSKSESETKFHTKQNYNFEA